LVKQLLVIAMTLVVAATPVALIVCDSACHAGAPHDANASPSHSCHDRSGADARLLAPGHFCGDHDFFTHPGGGSQAVKRDETSSTVLIDGPTSLLLPLATAAPSARDQAVPLLAAARPQSPLRI
jgi:hypothetical protein